MKRYGVFDFPVINACAIMKICDISIFTVTTVQYLDFCVLLFNIVDHQIIAESFIYGNKYIFPKKLSNITVCDMDSMMSIFLISTISTYTLRHHTITFSHLYVLVSVSQSYLHMIETKGTHE